MKKVNTLLDHITMEKMIACFSIQWATKIVKRQLILMICLYKQQKLKLLKNF